MSNKYTLEIDCISARSVDIRDMIDDAIGIGYETFARYCDWQDWARDMGYTVGSAKGMHLQDDFYVKYFKSTYRGKPCYYAQHSAIEYVFTEGGES